MGPTRSQRQMHSRRSAVRAHRAMGSGPVSSGMVASSTMRRCVRARKAAGSVPRMWLEDMTSECTCDSSTPTWRQ